ncbi:hypothetical protein NPIL_411951 [Nephila pilipes]|uniref:Uncharacterized protein n=1 Tax=Nephila pilipes TaxID=299642 RepID=A0A8X6TQB1_NEPPI|nr:hypothetical protein NPIL_411951 [Nephila pilipes]
MIELLCCSPKKNAGEHKGAGVSLSPHLNFIPPPLLDVHLALIDWWKRASGDTSPDCVPGYVSGNVQLFGNDGCLHFSCPTGGFHREGAGDCKGKIPHPHLWKNHVRRSGLSISSSHPLRAIRFYGGVCQIACARISQKQPIFF